MCMNPTIIEFKSLLHFNDNKHSRFVLEKGKPGRTTFPSLLAFFPLVDSRSTYRCPSYCRTRHLSPLPPSLSTLAPRPLACCPPDSLPPARCPSSSCFTWRWPPSREQPSFLCNLIVRAASSPAWAFQHLSQPFLQGILAGFSWRGALYR